MTYKTTIIENSQIGSKVRFNESNATALKNQIIQQVGAYCAELSYVLMVSFVEQVANKLRDLPVTEEMYNRLLQCDRAITMNGVYVAGHDVMEELKGMANA